MKKNLSPSIISAFCLGFATAIFLLSAFPLAAQTNPPYMIDYTTTHVGHAPGEYFPGPFQKVNSNTLWMIQMFLSESNGIVGLINGKQYISTLQTNVVLSSKQITTYSTNYAYWGASNFLARVHGIYKWSLIGGADGGNGDGITPSMPIPIYLIGSFSGTNGFFSLTNGFMTGSDISIAAISSVTNSFGRSLVTPGSATLFSTDHPQTIGITNSYAGQHQRFDDPSDPNDAATKGYADTLYANAFNNNFATGYDVTNGVTHFFYSIQNNVLLDIATVAKWVPINSFAVGAGYFYTDPYSGQTGFVPTNAILSVAQTNLVGAWQMQDSTNLALVAGFNTFTNYIVATNSGIVSFTITIRRDLNQHWFRVIKNGGSVATVSVPMSVLAGTLYPSNTWNLAAITNAMPNFSVWQGNSNGLALVTLSLSNGIVRTLQVLR
jgi:hypothetical protein